MIMSDLRMRVQPGKLGSLKQIFAEYSIFEKAIQVPGCLELFMVSSEEHEEEVRVVGFWEDRSAYQRWMDHPERGSAAEALMEIMDMEFDVTAPAQISSVVVEKR